MKTAIIVLSLIFIASLFVTAKAFTTPEERTIQQTQKLVEYQQEGAFDYKVYALPSYFQNGVLQPESEPIPVSFIETFTVTFDYNTTDRTNGSIRIDAILENPGVWKKAVNLVSDSGAGSVSFPIDIKYFQNLADSINKEIGVSASSHDLNIQATVPGGVSLNGSTVDFIQTMPVKLTRTMVKIGDVLTSTQGDASGRFGYQLKLGENTLYGPITITSPVQPTVSANILGPGDTIFYKLIQGMNVDFTYQLSANKPVDQVSTDIKIEAIAANPEKWSKTYEVVPTTRYSGPLTVTFPLDINQFTTLFDIVQNEGGVATSSQELTLLATVHTIAQTSRGQIDETFTQSITTNLRDGIMTWSGDMTKSATGALETTQSINESIRLWGRPVVEIRIIAGIIEIIILVLGGFFLHMYRNRRKDDYTLALEKANEVEKKYASMIIEVAEFPKTKYGDTVLPVKSLDDLIKVSRGLLKPVHHRQESNIHIYWVYDETKRYEYWLANGRQPQQQEKLPEVKSE